MAALDVQTNGGAADGKAENQRGQAGATGVRQTAQSQAAAIAPATGSPASVKLLVSSMDERLAAMQREIDTAKAQNRLLATRLRQIAAAYRSAAAPMGGASALGGMGGAMGGLRGLGGGMPNLGGLASAPMSALSRLSGMGNALTTRAAGGAPAAGMPGGGGSVLTRSSSPRDVAARIIWEAHRRRYSRDDAIAFVSTSMQEDGLDPDTVSPNGKWVGPFQQDAGYKGRYDPNENIDEFFNRLDAKRASGGWSDNIWKNIFWLQQAPGASSADAAYAMGRKGYLVEIQSRVMPATRLYNQLIAA